MSNDLVSDISHADDDLGILPVLLTECLIQRFTFWLSGSLHQGMRYEEELYELAYEFSAKSRATAFQIACRLLQHEIAVVITSAPQRYTVWVSLRSQSYPHWHEFKTQPSLTDAAAMPKQSEPPSHRDVKNCPAPASVG